MRFIDFWVRVGQRELHVWRDRNGWPRFRLHGKAPKNYAEVKQ